MSEKKRFDIVLVNADHPLAIASGTNHSLLRYLGVSGIAVPKEESMAETWTEVYMEPGASAHNVFFLGENRNNEYSFSEIILRLTEKAEEIPLVGEGKTRWSLIFSGASHPELGADFLVRLRNNWLISPKTFSLPHGAPWEHKEVSLDEQPKKKKTEKNIPGGLVGVRVEER